MQKLMTLTAAAVLLTASAAVAQGSIDAPNGGRETGHAPSQAPGQAHTAPHAASSRASAGWKRSRESCSQPPTTGHRPGAAAPEKTAASPPANGAIDQPGSPAGPCAPKRRS